MLNRVNSFHAAIEIVCWKRKMVAMGGGWVGTNSADLDFNILVVLNYGYELVGFVGVMRLVISFKVYSLYM